MPQNNDAALAQRLFELVRQDHRLKGWDVAFQPALLKLHIEGPNRWVHAIDRARLSGDLEEYAEEIVDEWEGRPTRGIIILPSGIEEVPFYLLDHEETFWPPTMPVKEPGKPTHFMNPSDVYRRVRLIEENVYVFVPDNRDPDAVLEQHRARIRDWLKKHPR